MDDTDSEPSPAGSHPPLAIVAIGASAGGVSALRALLTRFPKDSGLAFVVVVHLSPEHESELDTILAADLEMPVTQVEATVPLEPDHVYVIPPNANLDAADTHLRPSRLETPRWSRSPIDHFFRTLARHHGGRAIGIILSGGGSDGTLGLRDIKERNGLSIVQDPEEAEYDGMPRSALSGAPVDLVLSLADIPGAVLRFAESRPSLTVPRDEEPADAGVQDFLQRVTALVRARTGRDFSHYKRSTLLRRITRRMQFRGYRDPKAFLTHLEEDAGEVRTLADDFLVVVTSFFRDPEVFEALRANVVPQLFEGKAADDAIRVWSVGCATGEEAYSLAILLLEEAERHERPPAVQVFATDLHQEALDTARGGLYLGDIEADVSPKRLARYFEKRDGGYRVRQEVRDRVIFALHDALGDPPFSQLDLISCRNLLIYLERSVQSQLFALFHYALRPGGRLLLGTSERGDGVSFFRAEDEKRRLYCARNVPAPEPRLPVFPSARGFSSPRGEASADRRSETFDPAGLHRRLLDAHGPPSVLVSPENDVVHVSKRAGRFLLHRGGALTTSALQLVREELGAELRAGLSEARRGQPFRSRPISVRFDGGGAPVVLEAHAAGPPDEGFVLVLFEEQPPAPEAEAALPEADAESSARVKALARAKEEAEERLRALVEEHDTHQEELRASNEQLQSANEELRSTMEELETSKEELTSMNEELQTVNQENRRKVEELSELSSDLQNLLSATDIATLFLDRELCILRFTPRITELFNIRAADRGRPVTDITHRLGYQGLAEDARRVLADLVPVERELEDTEGRFYMTRVLPYRSADDRIAGVVITFVDITARRRAEAALAAEKTYAESIVETLPEPLLVLTSDFRVEKANAAFYSHFRVRREETEGRTVFELGNGQWDIPRLRTLLEEVLPDDDAFEGYVVDHRFEDLGRRVMVLNARRLDRMQLILLGIHDVTERQDALEKLRRSEERLSRMVNVSGVGVLTFASDGTLIDANDAFLSMTGYAREEVEQGRLSWRALTPPEHVEVSERQLAELAETGRLGPYEKEYVTKDGGRAWMLLAGAGLGDGSYVEYCIDVSDRKRAERALRASERRARLLLLVVDHAPELVAVFDLEGDALWHVNEALRRRLGVSEAAVRELTFADVFAAEARRVFEDEVRPELQRSGRWSGVLRLRPATGEVTDPLRLNVFRLDEPETGEPLAIATMSPAQLPA